MDYPPYLCSNLNNFDMGKKLHVIANVKDAENRMSAKFNTDTHKIYFVPMCAFGIRNTCYLQERGLNSFNNPYDNCVGIIRYVGAHPDVSPWVK